MVRVITQETFDEVVRENMVEFNLDSNLATVEAIAQFEAQGVCLSNIIKDPGSGLEKEHFIKKIIRETKQMLSHGKKVNEHDILDKLDDLKDECDKSIEYRIAAGKEGAYSLLMSILTNNYNNHTIVLNVLITLTALMYKQPDLLKDDGVILMKKLLDDFSNRNNSIVDYTLKWIAECCSKHEKNRQKIFDINILVNLKCLLGNESNLKTFKGVCQVIRRLVLDDDIRVEFGRAHEHARVMAAVTLSDLMHMLTLHQNNRDTLGDIMITITALMVRSEFCQKVDAFGGVKTILKVLLDYYQDRHMCQKTLKLLTGLTGNDDVKRSIIAKGGAPLITTVMEKHINDYKTTLASLSCIAALCLREPNSSMAFYEAGTPENVIEAMKIHAKDPEIQKNGSWVIRNMSVRNPKYSQKYIELGAEEILNDALKLYENEIGFDIKSALRDLGCKIKFDEQWKGQGGSLSY